MMNAMLPIFGLSTLLLLLQCATTASALPACLKWRVTYQTYSGKNLDITDEYEPFAADIRGVYSRACVAHMTTITPK